MHPRAGHGVTHFKKNRRAKKGEHFFLPLFSFLSLSLPLSLPGKKEARSKGERNVEEKLG